MKRHGKLFPKIVAMDNLYLASRLARKNKTTRYDVQKYMDNEDTNIRRIRDMLIDGTYHTSSYSIKTIYEPKEREIFILPFFPDRIIQHAIMNIVEPIWDNLFDDRSFSCRTGKGIHAGLKYSMKLVMRNKYCAKNDISKFYPSINHSLAMEFIERKIKDHKVLTLFEDLINSIDGDYNVPIGNYTSQWIGNLYLTEMDTIIRHQLKVHDYVRYCDDFLLFDNDKARLKYNMAVVEDYIHNRLGMRFSKKDLFKTKQGVDFLGYRMFPDGLKLVRKTTAKRIKKRFQILSHLAEIGELDYTDLGVQGQILSGHGWISWANTKNMALAWNIEHLFKECLEVIGVRRSVRREVKEEISDPFHPINDNIPKGGWNPKIIDKIVLERMGDKKFGKK